MTLGSVLLATAVLLLVGLVVYRPFLLPQRHQAISPTRRQQLSAEKDALLTEIRLLDFDFETGKLPSAEYEADRGERVQQAADILRMLDEMPEEDNSVEAQIEAAVAAIRQQVTGNSKPPAARHLPSKAWACTNCQNKNPAENRFCGKCGSERT